MFPQIPGGWMFKKSVTGLRECPNLRRTIAFEKKGCRAAGGVVAGLYLPLQQDDLPMWCQEVGYRCSGNATADDKVIGLNWGFHMNRMLSRIPAFSERRSKFAFRSPKNRAR